MENNTKQTNPNNKKLFVLVGVLVVVAIIIIVAASQGTKKANVTQEPSSPASVNTADQTGEENTTTPSVGGSVPQTSTRSDAPGAALITEDNKVVNTEGVELKNNVVPGSPEAPRQTGQISKDQVAKSAVSITVASTGFEPSEFRVKANEPVTLAITGGDPQWAHVFAFRSSVLSSIAVGIGGTETRAITFKAPVRGEYEYFCDIPGHPSRGEVGKMIVE